MSQAAVLEARAITKRFGGVTALKDVSFSLRPGEVHALCGENGAGKSTLIKLLSGIHPAGSYEGELFVGGAPARFSGVADAEAAGVAVIYQELALVPEMSVAENVFLGAEPTRGAFIDRDRLHEETARLLARFGLKIDPEAKARELGIGEQQLVEIVKALRKRSRILILDEPTAALAETEVEILLEIVRGLRREGISCVYISHKLDEVFALCDRITVLRDGSTIATMDAAATSKRDVIRLMVGREISELFPRRPSQPGEPLLRVENLVVAPSPDEPPVVRGVSFEARAGEVLGLGGLMGAGRTELLMHVFGAWGRRLGGRVELLGREHPPGDCAASLARGLALVSEDRRRYGLFFQRDIAFNISLSHLARLSRRGWIDQERELASNRRLADALRVKAPTLEFPVAGLSGGNQQKVVIGRAMMTEPKVIFFDEPTRGIDVGAKLEVYELINELTAAGKAVVLVSSELPELSGMSDRIVMLHEGKVGGVFSRGEAEPERLMAAATGHLAAVQGEG